MVETYNSDMIKDETDLADDFALPTTEIMEGYGDGILTTQKDWSQLVLDFIDNNPFTDALNGVDLTASGSCSFDYNWKGHTITFSVCAFQDSLNTFGSILLMISGFNSLLIIFRRR